MNANELEPRIRSLIKTVVKDLSRNYAYRYLTEQIPVYADEQLPPATMKALVKHGSPACFTGDYVAFSSAEMAKMLDSASSAFDEEFTDDYETRSQKPNLYDDWYLEREIETVLKHEFTHIICEHARLRQQHFRKNMDVKTWIAAEEIQANRGIGIDIHTLAYYAGVTDARFPEAINCKTLGTIYQAVKRHYGKAIENDNNSSNEAQPQENAGDNASCDKSLNAGQQQALNKVLNQRSDDLTTQGRNEQTASSDIDDDTAENADGEKLTPNADADAKKITGRTMKHESDEDIDGVLAQTPQQLLDSYNDRCKQKKIKQALSKLRSTIKGDCAKTKTKTYSRPPRRAWTATPRRTTTDDGLFRKGQKRDVRSVPKVLVALDKSGSMDSAKIKQIATTIDAIVKQLGRTTKGCYICLHDNEVKMVNPLSDWRKTVEQYYADGGNCFGRVLEKAVELNVDVVINVGDGLDSISWTADDNFSPAEKRIYWYDAIIGLDSYSWQRDYYEYVKRDTKNGLNRRCIDLEGVMAEQIMTELKQ